MEYNLRKIFAYLIGISIVFLSIYVPFSIKKRQKMLVDYEKNYWNQMDVEFCGIVKSKKLVDHGFGYVCLTQTKSNKEGDYELSINNEVFVCQIKTDQIIFITSVYNINIGDSLCYNVGGNRKEERFRNGEKITEIEDKIIVPTSVEYSPDKFSCL